MMAAAEKRARPARTRIKADGWAGERLWDGINLLEMKQEKTLRDGIAEIDYRK